MLGYWFPFTEIKQQLVCTRKGQYLAIHNFIPFFHYIAMEM